MAKYEHAGQPTQYRQEFCELLIEWMSNGNPFETFGVHLWMHGHIRKGEKPICRATLYNWAKDNPEFLDAKNFAKDCLLNHMHQQREQFIDGTNEKGNATVLIHKLKSHEQELYGDKQHIEVKGDGANALAAFSAETLNAMYKDAKANQDKE